MIRWARIELNGTTFELAGIHLTRPFYAELQQQDIAALIAFARSRTLPLVMAGDFNMSPWTEKLGRFERSSGLKRYNTFHFTWPMQEGGVPVLPLVAIDNVFASPQFARIKPSSRPAARLRPPAGDRRSSAGRACQTVTGREMSALTCRDRLTRRDSRAAPCGPRQAQPRARASPKISAGIFRSQTPAARGRRWA